MKTRNDHFLSYSAIMHNYQASLPEVDLNFNDKHLKRLIALFLLNYFHTCSN